MNVDAAAQNVTGRCSPIGANRTTVILLRYSLSPSSSLFVSSYYYYYYIYNIIFIVY